MPDEIISNAVYNTLKWLDEFPLLGGEGIIFIVLAFIALFFFMGWRFSKFHQAAPTLMTSVGILGTFIGIFIALKPLEFSPGKINESIEALLSGMTMAFVTSLLGILSAILFRFFGTLRGTEKAVSPEQREVLDRLDAIKQAIAGEGDSSMVTQMQKMRDENRDGFKKLDGLNETIRDALVKNLRDLIEEIRNIIGKQLGESLQDLIRNIEEALIKQFGSTFVEFNAATQAIKKWQEDHREQVTQLTAAFDLVAKRIAQIAVDCEKIPPTMDHLREIVEVAHRDVESLNRQVEAFAGMRQQAEESFPAIKKYLDKIGEDMANSAAGFTKLEDTIRNAFQSAEQETRRIAQQHSENVESVAAGMRETLEKVQRDSADKIAGIVESAVEKFRSDINKELDRVARAWGEQMLGIAERCKEVINKVEQLKR